MIRKMYKVLKYTVLTIFYLAMLIVIIVLVQAAMAYQNL